MATKGAVGKRCLQVEEGNYGDEADLSLVGTAECFDGSDVRLRSAARHAGYR